MCAVVGRRKQRYPHGSTSKPQLFSILGGHAGSRHTVHIGVLAFADSLATSFKGWTHESKPSKSCYCVQTSSLIFWMVVFLAVQSTNSRASRCPLLSIVSNEIALAFHLGGVVYDDNLS
jgi:hypothetical protein